MAITISGSGITSANIADGTIVSGDIADGTIVNADVADVAASKLTGALPAIDGSALTGITTGKVLQVVNADYASQLVSNSSSWVDTGLTATITPSSTTSKILVEVHQSGMECRNDTVVDVSLYRGASEIQSFLIDGGWTGNTNPNRFGSATCSKLDSPATTSAVVYKTMFRGTGANDVRVQSSGSRSSITLMEIGA